MEDKRVDEIGILKIFIKNFALELIISIIGMFILAIILSKTDVSDSIMGKTIIGISAFAIAIGGFLCGRKIEMKGIICGALQGIIYMVVMYFISSITNGNFRLSLEGIIMIIIRNYSRCYWWNYWSKFKIEKSMKNSCKII